MVLALIVVVAQLGAQTHAYTHLASAPDSTQHRAHAVPCSSAALSLRCSRPSVSSSYSAAPALIDQSSVCPNLTVAVQRAAICRAYRSRAPPLQS